MHQDRKDFLKRGLMGAAPPISALAVIEGWPGMFQGNIFSPDGYVHVGN